MSVSPSYRCLLSALLLVLLPSAGSRAAVVSGALTLRDEWLYPPEMSNAAIFGPPNLLCGGWVVSLLLKQDGNLNFVTGTAGSPWAWFRVAPGDHVDVAMLLGSTTVVGPRGPHAFFPGEVVASAADGTWFFGWWSNNRSFAITPTSTDCYGWMRFGTRDGKLVILEDAANLGGEGIIAGTLTAIPEPATLTLAGVAGLHLLRRRRTGRRRLKSP